VDYTLDEEQLNIIEESLKDDFMELGVHCVCMIDMAGNIIANFDNGEVDIDIYSLAALAAANFGAVNAIANIIGEQEFSLLFHKGKHESIHLRRVMEDFLLITIFGKETSLGFLRLRVDESVKKLEKTFKL